MTNGDVSASGVPWSDYGDYLASLMASGYNPSGPTAGTLTPDQQTILQEYQPAPAPVIPAPLVSPLPIELVGGADVTTYNGNGGGLYPNQFNGVAANYNGNAGPAAIVPAAAFGPVIALGLAALRALLRRGLTLNVGMFRALWAKWGPTVMKGLLGAAVISQFIELINQGFNDDVAVYVKGKGRRRRYSIGANPRIGTLIKVSKVCDRHTKRMYHRFRHAGLIRMPRRTRYPKYPQLSGPRIKIEND